MPALDLQNLPWQSEGEFNALLMIGDPEAKQYDAYKWIEAYAAQLSEQAADSYDYGYNSTDPVTVEELIETAMSHVRPDGWGDYITRGGAFEGESVDALFWDKLAIYMDIEIPHDKRGSFFSCSC